MDVYDLVAVNPLPTIDMRHGCSHFFHKAMGIHMGGLTLGANTLYVDICFFKPFFTYIAMVAKGLNCNDNGFLSNHSRTKI